MHILYLNQLNVSCSSYTESDVELEPQRFETIRMDNSTNEMRNCVVNVKRMPYDLVHRYLWKNKSKQSDKECSDSEDSLTREINYLTDLSNLERSSHKKMELTKKSKGNKKRRKRNAESLTDSEELFSSGDSESTVSDYDYDDISKQEAPVAVIEDLQFEILRNLSDVDDESGSNSDGSTKENEDLKNRKQKTNAEKLRKTKKRKIAKWRRDPLLCDKLTSSESDSDTKEPRKKQSKIVENIEDTESTIKNEQEEVNTENRNSAPLYEVTEVLSPSSDSNSDIELLFFK